MSKYAAYVICTSPRSGSTLLCSLLAATGVAGNPQSWFHERSVCAWLKSLNLTPDSSKSEQVDLRAVFKAALVKGTLGTGMFGLRLQRHSFEFFRSKLAVLYRNVETDVQRFEAAFGPTCFIHLSRQNKVEQAVSYVKARQTGLWHAAPDGTELERLSPPREPSYDADEIRAQVEAFTDDDEGWERWFANEQVVPVRIDYASLSHDPLTVLRDLLTRLGLSPSAATGVEIGLAKLADATNQQWVDRFYAETSDDRLE